MKSLTLHQLFSWRTARPHAPCAATVVAPQRTASEAMCGTGKTQSGVVLLEVMIAILLFSIGVLAIVGLQASMIKNTDDARYRAEASYVAQKRIGEMWADPVNIGTYVETLTDVSGLLPNGKRSVSLVPGTNEYLVTVFWQLPGVNSKQHNYTTTVVIAGA